MFGILKPRKAIPGMEFSGVVEAVGEGLGQYAVGTPVFGTTGMRMGTHAEYCCINEKAAVVRKPDSITHEQAVACIFGGFTALHFLRDQAHIQSGQNILINGASGAVGSMAVQLAKYYQATVTGICSQANHALVRSLGADATIDYTREDFTQSKERYDIIFDTVGNISLSNCRASLTPNGKLIQISGDMPTTLSSIFKKQLICGVASETKDALDFIRQRIEEGKVQAVIDHTYPLDQIAQAHHRVDTGHKKGSVVLCMP